MEEMTSKIHRWWWESKEKGRFWAMVLWDNLFLSKVMGGIGFRDLQLFNFTLFGWQVWRLILHRDTFFFRALSLKYFPEGDLFHPNKIDKLSFTWSSILEATRALNKGLGWYVGDGCRIWLDNHKLGFEGLDGNALHILTDSLPDFVSVLFGYHIMVVGTWIVSVSCTAILWLAEFVNIPNLPHRTNDRMVWFHNVHGLYTAKSAYSCCYLKALGLACIGSFRSSFGR
ncbi:hypothetical protein V6Z11_A11G277500 [Gossypium hirsutum]